jgi:hypothetical protein
MRAVDLDADAVAQPRELASGSDGDGVGRVLARLSDRVGVEVDGSHELLDLQLSDRR